MIQTRACVRDDEPLTVRRLSPCEVDQAFADARRQTGPYLLVDPEAPADLLTRAGSLLSRFDAVLGPTTGNGWWAFGLREPAYAALVDPATTALADAGALALAALRLGLRVAMLPVLETAAA
jgi:glycosyltransferase A (GT-A) superfamily protein (DUF2064 family)